MDGGVIELERLVLKDRKIRARDAKTMPRSRRRGEQKEVPLPRPSGKKIPRIAINAQWLADHPEDDLPSRIHAEDGGDDQDDQIPEDGNDGDDESYDGEDFYDNR